MKKVILCGTALLFSLGFMKAQGWQTAGAHDDFATTTPYANGPNGEGISWFETTSATALVITRPGTGDGFMNIAATNAGGAGNYPVFGANFNNDGAGVPTSYVVDLHSGADIKVDIENVSSQLLFMQITLEDINGVKSDYEPNVADVLTTTAYGDNSGTPNYYYYRKALNGFTIAAGVRKSITIDLSSVPGAVGGLTTVSYAGCATGPYYCPTTAYSIDATKIKTVIFTVNFGSSDINLSEGDGNPIADTFISGATINAYTGTIKLHDFKIGTVTTGVNEALIGSSLSIYPNPAKDALTVSFDANSGANVTLSDIAGMPVFSTIANIGSNKINVNTSNLPSGMYILNVATENGKVARKVTIE